jgi:hypothetical protein
VFVTRSGRRQTVTNVDHRTKAAIRAAIVKLDELGIEPISERVSPSFIEENGRDVQGPKLHKLKRVGQIRPVPAPQQQAIIRNQGR